MSNSELESLKLDFEFFKHLTIVNTAAAVLVPPVASALGPGVGPPTFALTCFGASVLLGVGGMCESLWRVHHESPNENFLTKCLFFLGPLLFLLGLGAFLFFVAIPALQNILT